jgi:hypothetical protein
MKKLVMTWTMAIVLFGWAGIAQTGRPVKPFAEPFLNISTTPHELNLGTTLFPGIHDSEAELTVLVESNFLHGSIMVSTTGLKRAAGGFVPPERISIEAPVTGGFVTMARPVAISEPEPGSHNIELNFRVETGFQDHQGKYTGHLTFMVMPP